MKYIIDRGSFRIIYSDLMKMDERTEAVFRLMVALRASQLCCRGSTYLIEGFK